MTDIFAQYDLAPGDNLQQYPTTSTETSWMGAVAGFDIPPTMSTAKHAHNREMYGELPRLTYHHQLPPAKPACAFISSNIEDELWNEFSNAFSNALRNEKYAKYIFATSIIVFLIAFMWPSSGYHFKTCIIGGMICHSAFWWEPHVHNNIGVWALIFFGVPTVFFYSLWDLGISTHKLFEQVENTIPLFQGRFLDANVGLELVKYKDDEGKDHRHIIFTELEQ